MGNSLKQKRSTRWNWIWRSEHFREGGGRRGSDAPEYNGCCFDSAILEQFIAMGAPRRTQQVVGPAASASCSGASSPCARRTKGKEQPATWRSRRRGTTEKCSETCVWRTSARGGRETLVREMSEARKEEERKMEKNADEEKKEATKKEKEAAKV